MTTTPEAVEAKASPSASPSVSNSARWWILAIACLAQLMVVLDGTIVNIAMPTAQAALEFDHESRQWIVTGYALAFGALLLVGGRLSDLLGRRKVLLIGLVGFAVASAVGGAAVNFEMLLAARVGQGIFAALLAPAALSIVTTTFTTPGDRAKAFAVFGAVSGTGGAVGLLLGGALTEYLSWRWCLYVNVPLAVIAVIGTMALIPSNAGDRSARLDVPGSILSVGGLVGLVYGLANAEVEGWGAGLTIVPIVAGVVLLAVFAYVETKVADPLLPLGVLLDRNRGGSFIGLAMSGAGMFAVFLFLTYYLAMIMGYGPMKTGVAFLPMIVAMMVFVNVATPLAAKIGPKIPMAFGFAVGAVGLGLFAQLELDSSYASGVLPGLIVMGLGMSFIMAPAMSASTDRVDPNHAGVASAAVNTFMQIGGSAGIAIFSALASSATADYLSDHADKAADAMVQAQAALESYTAVFWAGCIVFAAGAVISAIILRHGAMEQDPNVVTIAH